MRLFYRLSKLINKLCKYEAVTFVVEHLIYCVHPSFYVLYPWFFFIFNLINRLARYGHNKLLLSMPRSCSPLPKKTKSEEGYIIAVRSTPTLPGPTYWRSSSDSAVYHNTTPVYPVFLIYCVYCLLSVTYCQVRHQIF